jgi:hypothetical protein
MSNFTYFTRFVCTTVNLTSNFITISNADPIQSVRRYDKDRGGGRLILLTLFYWHDHFNIRYIVPYQSIVK